MQSQILFIQKRAHRAGAQTCLARLLRHLTDRYRPVLLCGENGWLSEECLRNKIEVIVHSFPNSRSLPARLFGNRSFAKEVAELLAARGLNPAIVHANDHQEGLLGIEIASSIGARTALFLRSPGMTKSDYVKYRCAEYGLIAAVGDEFRSRVATWDPARNIKLIHDGIEPSEFLEPKTISAEAPKRILVLGSPLDWKGWADLTAALYTIEQRGVPLPIEFDFTGREPDTKSNDLKLGRLRGARCNFLGRVEAFRELVRGYDLAINPSRMETFGMAAIEVLAAGVPLLSSRTGIIEQVVHSEELLFAPHDPASLASALQNALSNWHRIGFNLPETQNRIKANFLVGKSADLLRREYKSLLQSPAN
jgi:glycosyltransferase involved in cell wall biosynthesis